MGQGALNYQGVKGGIKLNDVIEEFKYVYQGKTITAGDFVNYINGVSFQTVDTPIVGSSYKVKAVRLSSSKVFILHSSTNSASSTLNGTVCTISNGQITVGTTMQISTEAYSGNEFSAVVMTLESEQNQKVFITYKKQYNGGAYGNGYKLDGIVCQITGTTVVCGTPVTFDAQGSTISGSGYATGNCIAKLTTSSVFVVYTHHNLSSSNDYESLYAQVCTVSGVTITLGTAKALTTNTDYVGRYISVAPLSATKVYITHSYSSRCYLYGRVCTISGTTITAGTDTVIQNETSNAESYAGQYSDTVALSSSNVFIAHNLGTSSYAYIYGMVCSISGTTITAGTDTELSPSINRSSQANTVVLISSSKVAVFFAYKASSSSNCFLSYAICEISGTSITAGTEVQLSDIACSGRLISGVMLDTNFMFIAHAYDSTQELYGQVYLVDGTELISKIEEQQVTLATQPPFDGIALSNGVGGTSTAHNEQVKIARLNV